MAKKKNNDITIPRGTSYAYTLTYIENVGPNLIGATVYFTVKRVESDTIADDASAVLEKTITNHIDPANGVTVIDLLDTDTVLAVGSGYWYDIKVKNSAGRTKKVVEGKVTIDGSPTNRNVSS